MRLLPGQLNDIHEVTTIIAPVDLHSLYLCAAISNTPVPLPFFKNPGGNFCIFDTASILSYDETSPHSLGFDRRFFTADRWSTHDNRQHFSPFRDPNITHNHCNLIIQNGYKLEVKPEWQNMMVFLDLLDKDEYLWVKMGVEHIKECYIYDVAGYIKPK
jgi:hypothetical protein